MPRCTNGIGVGAMVGVGSGVLLAVAVLVGTNVGVGGRVLLGFGCATAIEVGVGREMVVVVTSAESKESDEPPQEIATRPAMSRTVVSRLCIPTKLPFVRVVRHCALLSSVQRR